MTIHPKHLALQPLESCHLQDWTLEQFHVGDIHCTCSTGNDSCRGKIVARTKTDHFPKHSPIEQSSIHEHSAMVSLQVESKNIPMPELVSSKGGIPTQGCSSGSWQARSKSVEAEISWQSRHTHAREYTRGISPSSTSTPRYKGPTLRPNAFLHIQ